MTSIVLEAVVRQHGETRVIDHVDFEVASGEMVVLLGPSGCGKSTILRIISGLDQPDKGSIRIGGKEMADVEPAERMISMVFQSYGLFPHLSVRDNIVFGMQVRRIGAEEQRRRLERATEILGLASLLARKPSQLSGGQQQRVALARALVSERRVWLMDEPLSNLDVQLRASLRREIGELQRLLGLTMVYVTHDQTEAMTLADRIVLLDQGRVQQIGSPQELYDKPANIFTASFIGDPPMNLLSLTSSEAQADPAGFRKSFPKSDAYLRERGALTVGIRPSDFVRDPSGLPAKVISSEYMGGSNLVTCNFLGREITVLDTDTGLLPSGEIIYLRTRRNTEHLFDPDTATRIGSPKYGD